MEIKHLDSHQSLETLFKRDYDTDKFIICAVLPGDKYSTYISGELNDVELTYLIQCLKDRRRAMFGDD